jgi:hypothetical protein
MDTALAAYDRWQGIIPLIGGAYGYLLAQGYLPRNPKNPEKMALWRRKFGPTMKILGPLVALFGLTSLLFHFPN